MEWVLDNLATIVIGFLLLFAVAFAVRSVIRAHRHGDCSCGGSCSGCACSGKCPHSR